MTEEERESYYKWYNELWELSRELLPYYDIDKVKDWSVFVWTKDTEETEGENVFDINYNEIVFYDKTHKIIEEAKPIIKKIQDKFDEWYKRGDKNE